MKKRFKILISLAIGIIIFILFLLKTGIGPLAHILRNVNLFYFALFFIISFIGFFPITLRWKTILKAHGKRVKFSVLLKQVIAGFAVSYITPSAMVGGDPLRVYMLKKEAKVDYKTGTSSVILDRFVDLAASLIFIIIEISILFYLIPIHPLIRIIITSIIAFILLILFIFYYRTVKGKTSFSYFFEKFCSPENIKLKKFIGSLKDVENKMHKFFSMHKKEFFISCFWDVIYSLTFILEMKILLLSLGVNAGLFLILLASAGWGFANFFPVPAGLGILEGSEESLIRFIVSRRGLGFATGLLIRIRDFFFTAIGFVIIACFSAKQVNKKFRKLFKRRLLGL